MKHAALPGIGHGPGSAAGAQDLNDSYYCHRARWTKAPVLLLFPHWNWPGKEGREVPVWVHSNCDEVELFLNGVSQGKQTTKPFEPLEWKVKYASGKLVAKGRHKSGLIEAMRETVGVPATIRLRACRSALAADNADLAVVTVEVVDARGRVVPVAGNRITFTIDGPAKLLGVGNGDPGCHESGMIDSCSAFNGVAWAIVQTTFRAGGIILKAGSSGLKAARITLSSR